MILLTTLAALQPLVSAEKSDPPTLEQADADFQAERFEQAANAYIALTATDPSNARAWMGRGLDSGFSNAAGLESEPDLASLRNDDRFAGVVERARRNATPCKYDERYREFDFWVGEWEVQNAAGRQVGTNKIEETVNGCMLFENWTSASGGTGKSINFFDPLAGKWKQVWVDGSGGSITLEGGLVDGAMKLEGRHVYRDGRLELIRGAWTPLPDGRVRQHFEQSRDEGKAWYTWFDGYYRRSGTGSSSVGDQEPDSN